MRFDMFGKMMFIKRISRKGFHKTSLSLLDLCFKALPSRFQALRLSRGKVRGLARREKDAKVFRLNLSFALMYFWLSVVKCCNLVT